MIDSEAAPAKINLALHVTGRRADGYHLLDSLVVFPRIGDLVEYCPAAELSLSIAGTWLEGLETADNLVLKAARLFDAPALPGALTLYKELPVAGGVGGGSADAAATLRLLSRVWSRPMPSARSILSLGADVPVCLEGRSARMSGIGDLLEGVDLPPFPIVLANPRVPLSTRDVFRCLGCPDNAPLCGLAGLRNVRDLCGYLTCQRNDLEQPAIEICPVIGEVLAELRSRPGCLLARMSGSGATCFGIFADRETADAARRAVSSARPGWWVRAADVG